MIRRLIEPMRTHFEINDNTGTYQIIFYHKSETAQPTALREFTYEQFAYAKIYGNTKVFKDQKAIVGTHIEKVTEFNEVTNHFLSVFTAHCIRKKGVIKVKDLMQE